MLKRDVFSFMFFHKIFGFLCSFSELEVRKTIKVWNRRSKFPTSLTATKSHTHCAFRLSALYKMLRVINGMDVHRLGRLSAILCRWIEIHVRGQP